jgi:hypothetical protein
VTAQLQLNKYYYYYYYKFEFCNRTFVRASHYLLTADRSADAGMDMGKNLKGEKEIIDIFLT